MTDFFAELSRLAEKNRPEIYIEKKVLLSKKTSFKIGGAADVGIFPKNEEELVWAIGACTALDVPYYVLGRGSNVLAHDDGFRGAIIFTQEMSGFKRDGNTLSALAGTNITSLSREAGRMGLSGLEFACGIPGSVGGAVMMNAGAYGGEIKDVLKKCRVFLPDSAEILEFDNESCGFSYRHSVFEENGGIIISCEFLLTPDSPEQIKEREEDLLARRRDKQPLEYPSAGSAFKRPEGYFAAKLIEDSGLKGYSLGGAAVSEKHSGFVINKGDATSEDVVRLLLHVKKEVAEKFGVELSCEIRYLSPKGEERI